MEFLEGDFGRVAGEMLGNFWREKGLLLNRDELKIEGDEDILSEGGYYMGADDIISFKQLELVDVLTVGYLLMEFGLSFAVGYISEILNPEQQKWIKLSDS